MATGWRTQYFRYKDLFLNIVTLYKQRRDLRAFLELILSLSTVIIFVVFALKPTAVTIISLYNQIKDKQDTLNTLNQKVSNLQKANNVFNQNQNVIPDIDAAIFSAPEPDTISKQILGLAGKDSVSLLGVSVGQVMLIGKNTAPKDASVKPLPGGAQSMSVSISAKGNYTNLLAFIKDLENLRIPVKIDSLTINSSQTEGGSVIVGTITARVPYLGG
jgi:Tfp pilus assembly protein PilO